MKLFRQRIEELEDILIKIDKFFVQLDTVVSRIEESLHDLQKHIINHGDVCEYDGYE